VLYVVKQRSQHWADHSSRGVLPSVVCLSVILKFRKGGHDPKSGRSTTIWSFFFYKSRSLPTEHGSRVFVNFATDKGKIFETIGEEDVGSFQE